MGRHRTGLLVALFGIAVALIAAGPFAALSRAQTCDETWASTSTSGNWSTAASWSPASVPTSTQNVCLPAGSYSVAVTGSQSAGSVSVGTGVTLAVTISGSNGALLALNTNGGTSTNSGTIELTDTDTTGTGSPVAALQLDTGATLTNDGTIVSAAGAAGLGTRQIIAQAASSTLDNASDGSITVNQDLLLDSQSSGTFTTSGAVTIASGEKLLVGSAGGGTMNIAGGTITDNGTFAQGVSETGPAGDGTLNVTGGTITGAGLVTALPSSISFNGQGSGTYTVEGVKGATCGGPCSLSGTIGSAQTLVETASNANGPAYLILDSNVTNNGTIKLTDPDTTGASQEADLAIASGETLTNDGTIVSDPGGAGLGINEIGGAGTTGTFDNAATGTITINQDLQIDSQQSGLFATSGDITIASGKHLLADPAGAGLGGSPPKESAEMDINGGTITNNGAFEQGFTEAGSIGGSAALKVNGGTITGAGLKVVSGATSDLAGTGEGATFTGAGTGTYTFVGSLSANTTTLAGTIGANQTIVLSASTADGAVPVQLNSNVTNDGTIDLTDSDTSGTNQNAALIQIDTGDTLTNDGIITSLPGPTGAGQRVINGQTASGVLDNASGGTISAQQDLQIDNGQQGTFTTAGTITVPSGGTLQLDPNGGSTFVNLNGGTVTNNGTAEIGINGSGNAASGATFNVNGGTVAGNPIISATATTNFSGSGSGSFMLEGATSIFGGGTLSGTIGANDNVTMSATSGPSGSAGIQTSGAVVNDGTFTMTDPDSSASSSIFDELNIGSGSSFTNNGVMVIAPGPVGSGYRSIDGTLTNTGTLDVNMLLQLGLHAASTINNSGTVDVGSGQAVMTNGGAYTQSAGTTNLGGAGAALSVGSVFVGGGQITGAGTICGQGGSQAAPCGSGSSTTSVLNGGTVAPGPTPATITVQGDYTQSSGGALAVGVNASGNDELSVTGAGTASLDGALQVSTASGFTPSPGTSYEIVGAPGGVSGTFASTSGTGPYNIAYNAGSVTLTAATAAPAVSFNPTSFTFGSASNTIAAGTTSQQTLTITNSGHAALVLGTLSLGGSDAADFSLSADQCSGQTLQAGSSCTVSVGFAPATAGTDSAQLSVPDNAAGSPQQVALTGFAGAAGARATASPSAVDFGPVGVGVPAGMTVTVQSTGTGPLSISHVSLGGADAGDYAIGIDTCAGATVAVGKSCKIGLTLRASAAGSRQASLSIADNAPGNLLSVALTGSASATGTLTGAVTTTIAGSALPLPGAGVDLCTYNATTDLNCRSATASGAGEYTFTGIAPGAYRMEALPPKPLLQPASAVVQVAAGPNTEDFTLTAPQPIPAGVSINGQTSGTAGSFWTNPDVIDVPLDPAPSGTPGVTGVTVVGLQASPAGGEGLQPTAFGELQVEYRFDAGGVPRFVALSLLPGEPASFGSWSASLVTPPSAGADVRGLTVQAVFTPSLLATGVATVNASAGGQSSSVSAPIHGEFDYTISHYSVFGHSVTAAAAARSLASRGGSRSSHELAHDGTSPGGDLTAQIANPSTNPSGTCTTSGPSYEGNGNYDLGGGYYWDATAQPPMLLHTQNGIGSNVTWNANGDLQWQYYVSYGLGVTETDTLWSPETGFNSALVDSGGFASGPGITIASDGQSFTVTSPNDPNSGRYVFHQDGFLTDTWTGVTYGKGETRSFGRPNTPVGCAAPPASPSSPPSPSDAPPPPMPQPNSPDDGWWPWDVVVPVYKDPSGTVLTTNKIPVAGARVVLERSAKAKGPFKAVPKGSIVMSPSNRRNPDHTTALGGFGWDVVNGFYRITAQHSRCRAVGGGSVTHTRVLAVPPPVTGLRLVLRCPHLTRAKTHMALRAKLVPVGEVALTATIKAGHKHRPAGLVEFTLRGRRLGYVPLQPRSTRVVFTVAGKSTKGFRALYLGDGYNAPSRGAG